MFGRRQAIKAARRANAEGTISLAKLRVWHTQETGGGAGTASAATQNTEHMIPKSRFDEVNERAQKAEAALAKLQTDHETAESERLRKQGEWQTIAENAQKTAEALTPFKQRAETLEKTIADGNKARVERVPEANRALIPVDYPPERLQGWLDTNWERLIGKPAPNIDAGAGAGGAGGAAGQVTLTPEELAHYTSTGMTAEQALKAKQRAEKDKRG